jgi:hypothetical protein
VILIELSVLAKSAFCVHLDRGCVQTLQCLTLAWRTASTSLELFSILYRSALRPTALRTILHCIHSSCISTRAYSVARRATRANRPDCFGHNRWILLVEKVPPPGVARCNVQGAATAREQEWPLPKNNVNKARNTAS